MKVKHLLVTLLVPFACACSNDSLNEVVDQSNQPQVVSRSVENMLSFDSEASFNQLVNTLSKMSTMEECKAWINTHLGNSKSLYDVYMEAMEDAADLDESREAYLSYKNKYEKELYFSTYKDDCGAYLPVSNKTIAMLLNTNGDVQIGNEVRNLKDIHNYTQLQEAGVAMYDGKQEKNYVESRANFPVYRISSHGQNFGPEYDSGWRKGNKRKLRVKIGRQADNFLPNHEFTTRNHIEISFRKKTFLGWANYSSYTHTTGKINGVNVNWEKTADSSHDFYAGAGVMLLAYVENGVPFYYSALEADLSVTFRG